MERAPRLFYSVTRDPAKHILYLKVVNASSNPQPLNIKLGGAAQPPKAKAGLISLSARSTAATNTLTEPTLLVPVQSSISGIKSEFQRTFPPYSIQILELEAN